MYCPRMRLNATTNAEAAASRVTSPANSSERLLANVNAIERAALGWSLRASALPSIVGWQEPAPIKALRQGVASDRMKLSDQLQTLGDELQSGAGRLAHEERFDFEAGRSNSPRVRKLLTIKAKIEQASSSLGLSNGRPPLTSMR